MKRIFHAAMCLSGLMHTILFAMDEPQKNAPELTYFVIRTKREPLKRPTKKLAAKAIFSSEDERGGQKISEMHVMLRGKFFTKKTAKAFLDIDFRFEKEVRTPNHEEPFYDFWVIDCSKYEDALMEKIDKANGSMVYGARKAGIEEGRKEGFKWGAGIMTMICASTIGTWWLWNRYKV